MTVLYIFKDYEHDLKYRDLNMEDFNEDDEVWSNPVTDTLKISNSEQIKQKIDSLSTEEPSFTLMWIVSMLRWK